MKHVAALLCGVLFAAGLMVSGMTDPARVVGFLDVQAWDPTLMFVMGGALLVTTPTFFFAKRQTQPVLDAAFRVPVKTEVDRRLVAGAALFGAGWGLSGLCPGPALVSVATARLELVAFALTMVVCLFAVRTADVRRVLRSLESKATRVDGDTHEAALREATVGDE
ncbi:MAG: YeeE/YedE family protein [Myxococcales bacterium]|nr:YeeE/YedE family protein [Myxococcales bacterium]MCB9625800.1 YeeE/YedE family protein [Sandaracinaceae bacterium]